MKNIALVLPERFDELALLQLVARLSRRKPLLVRLCSPSPQPSDSQCQLMAGLEAMGATVSTQLAVTPESLAGLPADLVLVAPPSCEAPRAWRTFIRDLSRRLPAPVWIMNAQTAPPSAVTALIDPDGADCIDPQLATEVLRVSLTLARVLDVPLDILNVWHFLDEGLLRSRRLRMPEPEINEKKRRAAWIAQSDLGRVLAALPPDLSWRRLDFPQGPITESLQDLVADDILVVTGSAGGDGWAARFRPNLAEALCRGRQAPIVIVKKPDARAMALLNGTPLQDCSMTGTTRSESPGSHRKKRTGSY